MPIEVKRALITGITGQDGSYLAEHLLSVGYQVHGMARRVAIPETEDRFKRISHIMDRITLHSASLENYASLYRLVANQEFTECYHLAAQSFVPDSFADEFTSMETNVLGTQYLIAALRDVQPECRVYFAGSSEMFGEVRQVPQDEQTNFHPRSPYGISKVAGFHLARNFREAYDMHCSSGILFNHESPRRGSEFVTRKIASGAAKIFLGLETELVLGNLEARRDWGHAADYVAAMSLMLQQDDPDDYVVASGEDHSVRDFCEAAFSCVDLDYRDYVRSDPRFMRPAEVSRLLGDATKAREKLGWQPKYTFQDLVREMVEHDLDMWSKYRYIR
ncbi:GDP-mannose 4,6-dehydratase [Streptomyces sp. NPDC088270]|uniref:GDP-mannose 4,6-dehydratase n=1 Tax=Streptomyces sp. NPDC088270 TaxID=3160990 RepID=UPI0034487CEE